MSVVRRGACVVAVALCIPVAASAATADFRVLVDADNNASTGCTVRSMRGVEQAFTTRIETTETSAQITRSFRQVCTGGAFGAAIDLDLTARPAGFDPSTGAILAESRIAFSAFTPAGIPRGLHLGFDASDDISTHAALTLPNGAPIIYPPLPASRRRAVGEEPHRAFILDGLGTDWAGISPLIDHVDASGRIAIRLLKVYAFADSGDRFIYFRFDAMNTSDVPFASDDAFTRRGDTLSVPAPGVLANDLDPTGHALTVIPVSLPAHGNITLNPDGSFTYVPANAASLESDSFNYRATNGKKESNTAKVTIDVSTVTHAPVASNDAQDADEDKVLFVSAPGVLKNDADEDGQTLTASLATLPSHGSVTLNANGSFTYQSEKDFFGTDSFTYVASDGTEESSPATVTMNVRPVNDPPAFTCGGDVIADIEDGTFSLPNWAKSMSAGPANESSQSLAFALSVSLTMPEPDWFKTGPFIDRFGTLSFTTRMPFMPGTAWPYDVSVSLVDDGGVANGGANTSAQPCAFRLTLDSAPQIAGSHPAQGEVVGAGSNYLSIAFSEFVTVSGDWFELSCTASGTRHPADVNTNWSGVPRSAHYADIRLKDAFVANETCTMTIFGSQVTDQDTVDAPDAMIGNQVFSFTVSP